MIRNVLTGVSHSQEELGVLGRPNCQDEKKECSKASRLNLRTCPCFPSLHGDPFQFLPLTPMLQIHYLSNVIYWYLAKTSWEPWGFYQFTEDGFVPEAVCFQCSYRSSISCSILCSLHVCLGPQMHQRPDYTREIWQGTFLLLAATVHTALSTSPPQRTIKAFSVWFRSTLCFHKCLS